MTEKVFDMNDPRDMFAVMVAEQFNHLYVKGWVEHDEMVEYTKEEAKKEMLKKLEPLIRVQSQYDGATMKHQIMADIPCFELVKFFLKDKLGDNIIFESPDCTLEGK